MAKTRHERHDRVAAKEAPTWVYVMTSAGKVKVGIAGDVALRLRQLQNGAAAEVELVHSRQFSTRLSAERVERSLHHQYRAHRSWGEWFIMNAADAVAALNSVADPSLHSRQWVPGMPADVLSAGPLARWKWCRDHDEVLPA